jgi:hypothetical protein
LIKLENLPEATEKALACLRATDSLKSKIINEALQEKKTFKKKKDKYLVPVLLSSVALLIFCVFLLNGKKSLSLDEHQLIYSFTAGSSDIITCSFDTFYNTDPSIIQYIELNSFVKKDKKNQLNQLIDALKNQSVISSEKNINLNDQLNFYDSNGLIFSLPVKAPFIGWSDGIRKCDLFFKLFEDMSY